MLLKTNKSVFVVVVVVSAMVCLLMAGHSSQERAPRQKGYSANNTCGSYHDLAGRVELCAKPAMDIVEGTLEKWPRNEEDTHELCQNWTRAEKCVREEGRKCGKGLQKTIISTLGSSVQRIRKRECVRQNYINIQNTMECVEKHQDRFRFMIANITNQFKGIEKQMSDLDKRVNAICCVVVTLESDMRNLMDSICPKQTLMVMRLYRAILDDTFELVCRSVKCDNVFKGIVFEKVRLNADRRKHSGLVSSILGIIFGLDSN